MCKINPWAADQLTSSRRPSAASRAACTAGRRCGWLHQWCASSSSRTAFRYPRYSRAHVAASGACGRTALNMSTLSCESVHCGSTADHGACKSGDANVQRSYRYILSRNEWCMGSERAASLLGLRQAAHTRIISSLAATPRVRAGGAILSLRAPCTVLQLTAHLERFQRLSVERAQLLELPDAIAP